LTSAVLLPKFYFAVECRVKNKSAYL